MGPLVSEKESCGRDAGEGVGARCQNEPEGRKGRGDAGGEQGDVFRREEHEPDLARVPVSHCPGSVKAVVAPRVSFVREREGARTVHHPAVGHVFDERADEQRGGDGEPVAPARLAEAGCDEQRHGGDAADVHRGEVPGGRVPRRNEPQQRGALFAWWASRARFARRGA